MIIKELMVKDLVCVTPDQDVSSVVSLMNDKNISCIIVSQNDKPEGIIT